MARASPSELPHHLPAAMQTCPRCFGAIEGERFWCRCPACAMRFRVEKRTSLEYPPGASVRGVPNQLAWDPVPLVAHELARFPEGLTYDRLKKHLATLFVERSIRDKYLRFYLERGVAIGIIRVENGVFFAVVRSA